MFVIDTSVAIKWFIPEEGSLAARKLLHHNLAAPDLLLYEFSNYLSGQKSLSHKDRRFLLKTLYQFPVEYFVLPEDAFQEVLNLALEHNITAYDASFITLAERLNAPFVTADKKLTHKTKALKFVKPLTEDL